jgi:hypothetical protein
MEAEEKLAAEAETGVSASRSVHRLLVRVGIGISSFLGVSTLVSGAAWTVA